MRLLLLILSLIANGGLAAAQDASSTASAVGPLVFKPTLEWISAVRAMDPAPSRFNPGNRALRLPQLWAQTELRPNLRVELGSRATFVVRPRIVAWSESAWADGLPRRDLREVDAHWTELYLNLRPNDIIQFTYGLQNYQWGPAELLSPSNRIFHEVGVFRDAVYYVRGRHLARLNVSAGKEWSLVALAELGDNGEPDFNAGEPFRRQGQAKLEYAAPSGIGYVGATIGVRQGRRAWFGEYGSYALTEGLSAYLDATHARGSDAWYPVRDPQGLASFARRDADAGGWRTLAVGGLRYTFVNGTDARLELMHQDAGYSNADLRLAAEALASVPVSAAASLAPGLELFGRRLALLSVRLPDLPPDKHLVLQGRYLRSLTDRSGVLFATATLETTDRLVLFASGALTHGRDVAEFSRAARATLTGGAVWTW